MFDEAMRKSIESYLEPGEQLLDCQIVQGKGMIKALAFGGVATQSALGAYRDRKSQQAAEAGEGGQVQLASKMGLAVTSQRLLIFKAGGAVTLKATELLTEVPAAEVDSIEIGKGAITKPLTITVRGESFQVDAPKASNPGKLVEALEQAKRSSPAVA
jgi:hypothetical protein